MQLPASTEMLCLCDDQNRSSKCTKNQYHKFRQYKVFVFCCCCVVVVVVIVVVVVVVVVVVIVVAVDVVVVVVIVVAVVVAVVVVVIVVEVPKKQKVFNSIKCLCTVKVVLGCNSENRH